MHQPHRGRGENCAGDSGAGATALDHVSHACLLGDRTVALGLLGQHPALREQIASADGSTLIVATESGNTKALDLLLESGFPAAAEGRLNPAGVDGCTALHAAAWAGSPEAVARLLAAGVPVDALDGNWQSTSLVWALIGSSERRAANPSPDWVETVRVLLDAGTDTSQINLDPAEPHPPVPGVIELLRARGIVPLAASSRPPRSNNPADPAAPILATHRYEPGDRHTPAAAARALVPAVPTRDGAQQP